MGAPGPGLDLADDHQATLGHHGERVAQRLDGLRVELAGASLVVVEIAEPGIQHSIDDGADRLVLQHVLLTVEVHGGRNLAAPDQPGERLEGLLGHGGILPHPWLLTKQLTYISAHNDFPSRIFPLRIILPTSLQRFSWTVMNSSASWASATGRSPVAR